MSDQSAPLATEKTQAEQKLDIAKEKKAIADKAFSTGETKEALRFYHEALMYLIGIDKNALKAISGDVPPTKDGSPPKTKTEADEIAEKIYANQSACHLKNSNWQRAIETADKALKLNENNFKAMFRKGKALGEQGFFEKSVKVLQELKSKNPSDTQAVSAEIARLRAIDNAREKVHKEKLKGFLSRDFKSDKSSTASSSAPAKPSSAFIEEVVDAPVVAAA